MKHFFLSLLRVCHKKENGHLLRKKINKKNGCGGDPFFKKMEVMLWIMIIKHLVLSNVNFIFNKRNERKAKREREKQRKEIKRKKEKEKKEKKRKEKKRKEKKRKEKPLLSSARRKKGET